MWETKFKCALFVSQFEMDDFMIGNHSTGNLSTYIDCALMVAYLILARNKLLCRISSKKNKEKLLRQRLND